MFMHQQHDSQTQLSTEKSINYGVLPTLVGFNLRRTYFIATQIFAEHFRNFSINITPIQFAIIHILANNVCLTQKEISIHIGTAPSVIVKPIRDLEEQGVVTRTRDPKDRRNHQLQLTEQTQRLLDEMRQRIIEVDDALMHGLSSDERETMVMLLNKIVESHLD